MPSAGPPAATASGRCVARTSASPPPMQKPITPTLSRPPRRRTSSTAPLMSRAAWSIFIAIIALPASSGSSGPPCRDGVDEAPPLLDDDHARPAPALGDRQIAAGSGPVARKFDHLSHG